jgi:uncharacterized membrane protein
MIPRLHLWIVMAILFAGTLLSIVIYPQLPAIVPTHWNFRGEVDGYGPRWMDTAILPACSWFIMTLMVLLPRITRFHANFTSFARIYGRICVSIALTFFVMHVVLVLKAAGRAVPLERMWPMITGLLIAILGNWMGKIRRNGVVGIRTPGRCEVTKFGSGLIAWADAS